MSEGNKHWADAYPKVNYADITSSKVEEVTVGTVRKAYGKKVSIDVIENVTAVINEAIRGEAEHVQEFVKDNAIGMLHVLSASRTNSINEYMRAARFITYRQMGDTFIQAYAKTFPDRVKRLEADGMTTAHLSALAQAFGKTKLVTQMTSMLIVPAHLIYQDVFHKAVQTQAALMMDDTVSPKVRSDAANSLLTHLKQPEVKQMELQVKVNESNILEQFKEAMTDMARKQKSMIELGDADVVDVSAMEIYSSDKDNLNAEDS